MKVALELGDDINASRGALTTYHVGNSRTIVGRDVGDTALHIAVVDKLYQVAEFLVKNGADPNIPTFAGTTALMAAAGVNWVFDQTYDEGQPALLEALKRFKWSSLSDAQQLDKLRIISLSCIRQGRPAKAAEDTLIAELDVQYPAKTEFLNREIAQVLIYLRAPSRESGVGRLTTKGR